MLDLKAKKILLIEDYPVMRKAIRDMLYSLGVITLIEAENGQKAINAMQAHKFDIVLCDYNLGTGKNGLQVLEEARFRRLLASSAAFIMVTAEQVQGMVLSAMENKPDEYLTKPFTAQLLLTRLERTFERKLLFKRVNAATSIDNYSLAIKYCDKLLEESPKKVRTVILKKRAELAVHTQDYVTAQDIYQNILEQRELNWALLGIAQINYLQGNTEEAIGIFQEIISKYPMTMEAYDLLAQSYEATEKHIEAQEALHKAVQLSPQTILRQRKLATIANKTGDLKTAENACKAAVELGRYSIHKSSNDFSNLAQIFKKADKKTEALEVLQTMRAEFPNDPSAELRATIAESEIYQSMGDTEQAEEAFNKALSISKQYDQILDKEIKLEMSKTCYQNNQEEMADTLINHLIKSHIDDDNFINEVNAMHNAIGRKNHVDKLINATRQELTRINNEGVKLYQQEKFIESIAVFAKAFKAMPENKTIILNMTKIILHNIKVSGSTKENMAEAKFYINKAKKLGVAQYKLNSIQMEYAKLVHSFNKTTKK
ncbi:tetratricopeptide repeat-containing response regulator [methanotrophic endosymbiont of Bathymodiolus puteoserpentis (Logatchev)]|jgi:tetratricopeptide (TPR) repeat protein|uniref:tetratricopeptide repeat-containing response regulator n=1 Tax=methanotrophic endosymbiont of Bathymodiolus puteoserpentis (Logatchev) TaxID=343235 RepID=UPI0013CA2259|nr:tetratricopeptide repeat-containing response regulator [methanotrophic endosymbiont of Bathymodiolus puteoserpentis (Logatchev)]SHE18998.1 Chemotaxis regulator-transmits chemoreceptor signals to flagelllar motor components CheY [methanotrophic endosymbiont of Bathymodiolus puteoserpentis (Logatchev)]